jgi:hypothetical protein
MEGTRHHQWPKFKALGGKPRPSDIAGVLPSRRPQGVKAE